MKAADIVQAVYGNFTTVYRGATPFVNSGALWNFCIGVIGDPMLMSNVIFANDMGVPPVKSLLEIYKRRCHPSVGFEFTKKESQNMGALMAYVFKFVLGYRGQKERCAVHDLGIGTATRYFDGPIVELEL